MASSPDYVIIADPDSLRWKLYCRDLDRHLNQFHPRPTTHLLPWAEVIKRDGDITDRLPSTTSLVRVESPARDPALFAGMMQAGHDADDPPLVHRPSERGAIRSPRLIHRGLCRILGRIEACVDSRDSCRATSSLADTRELLDKNAVSRILREHDIPTPDSFVATTAEGLINELWSRGWHEAYVKLAYGSCASGIAHLGAHTGTSMSALTTVAQINGEFYNSRKVRTVASDELERLLRFLIGEDVTVQRAVRKTRLDRDPFDVRVVVVDKKIVASVFRASHLPITNLHLGGYRADPRLCRRVISDRDWADAMDVCLQAAQHFDMAALGIDLAFERETLQPQILEINAFGDFFPKWTDADGRTIHQIEIAATAARMQRLAE